MINQCWMLRFVSCAVLVMCGSFNDLQAGVIPWTYSAIFGPPGSLAQMRAERLSYRAGVTPYAASYGYASGYGMPMNYGYASYGNYGGYSVGYSPFDSSNSFGAVAYGSNNCCGSTPYVAGYSYLPSTNYYAGGCSSCAGCSSGGCTGPGCAPAVTPAGGLKPQVEPSMVNPSNAKPTPNANYLDQPTIPKTNTPSTFMNEGLGNPANSNAPNYFQPENIESRKTPTDNTEMNKSDVTTNKVETTSGTESKTNPEVKPDSSVDNTVDKVESSAKPEENSAEKKTETTTNKRNEAVEETIKNRQPAPPNMPETGIKNRPLEIPNPDPVASHLPTIIVLDVVPTRVTRTAKFFVPTVARHEAKILPGTLPASVVAQK